MPDRCRFCAEPLREVAADLGLSPVSNHFRASGEETRSGQCFYPLLVMVCTECWLVQLAPVDTPPHFHDNYPYFSSYSSSWLRHAEAYATAMVDSLDLGPDSLVVEAGSNDGYLLRYFKAAQVPVLGIEPSRNVAERAREAHGIGSIVNFFGSALAERLANDGRRADLFVANNVLAHVPELNDFVAGISMILKPEGTATFEFPHLLRMLEEGQFDTIYHEHFSYLSLTTAERVFSAHGLELYGAKELPTHGGSLRLYVRRRGAEVSDPALARIMDGVRTAEADAGLSTLAPYRRFREVPAERKCELLEFLIDARRQGKSVVGYGAPAKGNTMLNYCGVGPEFMPFTTDRNPEKQGLLLPGLDIPVRAPGDIDVFRPDYLLILPWNLREEIVEQMSHIRSWGGRFVVAMPGLEVF